MTRAGDKPGPRRLAVCLLVLLLITAATGLVALYANTTHSHVELVLVGHDLGGADVQVYINCASTPLGGEPRAGVHDLGWLEDADLITIQARSRTPGPYLEFFLRVDGHREDVYNSGTRQADSPTASRHAGWSVARTYSATGREVADAGCRASRHMRPTMLRGPPVAPASWYEDSDRLFTAATVSLPILFSVYFYAGMAALMLAIVCKTLLTPATSPTLRILYAFVGLIIELWALTRVAGTPWLDDVIAVSAALGSAALGVWWLRHDVARIGRAMRDAMQTFVPPRTPTRSGPQPPTETTAHASGPPSDTTAHPSDLPSDTTAGAPDQPTAATEGERPKQTA